MDVNWAVNLKKTRVRDRIIGIRKRVTLVGYGTVDIGGKNIDYMSDFITSASIRTECIRVIHAL